MRGMQTNAEAAASEGSGVHGMSERLTVEHVLLRRAWPHDLVKGKALRLMPRQHCGDGVADDLCEA